MTIGAGTVTNIISQWKEKIGFPTADTLRDLATELKRLNINALQCANGYRLLNMIKTLGTQEENIEPFLTQIYNLCISKNIAPELVVKVSQVVLALDDTIPLSEIPEYMQQKVKEKLTLEQEYRANVMRP